MKEKKKESILKERKNSEASTLAHRINLAFTLIMVISFILSGVFFYGFNTYFQVFDYYSNSYYELNNFRDEFSKLNTAVENYYVNNDNLYLQEYEELDGELKEICSELSAQLKSNRTTEEQQPLIRAITNSYETYSERLNHLLETQDTEGGSYEYYKNFTNYANFIVKYVDELLYMRFSYGQQYYENVQKEITFFKSLIIVILVIFIVAMVRTRKRLINNVVFPIKDLSEESVTISKGTFSDKDISNNGYAYEVAMLISNFNGMKRSLRNMLETTNRNLEITQSLLYEQQKNQKIAVELQREQMLNEILTETSSHDGLTGILNRSGFERRVEEYTERFFGHTYAFFIVDMDYFKRVNDTFGHDGGDEVLKLLANVLKEEFSRNGFSARWGGDEFVGFMTNVAKREEVEDVAHNIKTKMNRPFIYNGQELHLSVSIGVCISSSYSTVKAFYLDADAVLYKVKESTKNNFMISDNTVKFETENPKFDFSVQQNMKAKT